MMSSRPSHCRRPGSSKFSFSTTVATHAAGHAQAAEDRDRASREPSKTGLAVVAVRTVGGRAPKP